MHCQSSKNKKRGNLIHNNFGAGTRTHCIFVCFFSTWKISHHSKISLQFLSYRCHLKGFDVSRTRFFLQDSVVSLRFSALTLAHKLILSATFGGEGRSLKEYTHETHICWCWDPSITWNGFFCSFFSLFSVVRCVFVLCVESSQQMCKVVISWLRVSSDFYSSSFFSGLRSTIWWISSGL